MLEYIQIGRIMSVDPNNYSVNVDLMDGENPLNIRYASSYVNPKEGNGLIFVPAIDSQCLVGRMMNGEYVIIGFIPMFDQKRDANDEVIDDEVGYRNDRPLWLPDDIGLVGAKNNFVQVQGQSGIVHVQASPLCQTYFIPDPANIIKMITDNLEIQLGKSLIKLINARKTGQTSFELKVQSNPNSDTGIVTIRIGKEGNLLKILVDDQEVFNIATNKVVTVNNNLKVLP